MQSTMMLFIWIHSIFLSLLLPTTCFYTLSGIIALYSLSTASKKVNIYSY
jgi:hypothetical protein